VTKVQEASFACMLVAADRVLQLPIGPLSASQEPTTYYIYNPYGPNARFVFNH